MPTLVPILLFIGALLLAIGLNTPATVCSRIGSVLLAVGFGIALLGGFA